MQIIQKKKKKKKKRICGRSIVFSDYQNEVRQTKPEVNITFFQNRFSSFRPWEKQRTNPQTASRQNVYVYEIYDKVLF